MAYNAGWTVEWDAAKNQENQRKHGVSLEEASELFTSGTDYLEFYDEQHSAAEDRFIAIGPIRRGVVLVAWTERQEDVIRLISARWATRRERRAYDLRIGGRA
ncbi:MAG TPA: BrnT family toxin [Dehalococcoidia bacterium]|nr:BrnT family toxin [Dehalococcoidia bacterium]